MQTDVLQQLPKTTFQSAGAAHCTFLFFQQNEVAGGPSMAENYKDSNPPESLMEERAHTTPGSLLLASNIKRKVSHDVVSAVLGAP